MNWRWRALAQKIDPAMLASTVTEYLLPKIELGLLFAYGISDQMCRSWTRTIIDTLAVTANMTKTITRLMSVEATCCLAGIPDIGLRMQTLRITEFFLLINSSNCISGKTTLARLCALKHKSPAQMEQVLQQLFDKDTKINHRKENRLGDTFKWMKNLSLHITEKGDIPEKINNLAQVLQPGQTSIFWCTLAGQQRQETVRSDGNNFVAEMAAATVVIKALPRPNHDHVY